MAGGTLRTICGIQSLDGGRIEPGAVLRLNDAAKTLVASRQSHWAAESIGLACNQAAGEVAGPAAMQSSGRDGGRRVLVFDGRIDNRRELLGDLHGRRVDDSADDGELILAAYDAWGDAFVSRLVGDFALGLWDGGAGRFLCARDPLGVRPLYVHVRDDRLCFATQLRQLLATCPGTPAIDLEYVADRVSLGVDRPNSGRTPYRGVSRLEPGHRLIAENGRARVEPYWEWSVRGGSLNFDARDGEEEYVERFLHMFSDAVESRMSGVDGLWSELSGGLDSSSIVSVAARQRGRRRLSAVTVVFDQSTFSDEREWAAAVSRAAGIEGQDVDGDAEHPFGRFREAVQYWEEPHSAAAFFGVHAQCRRLIAGGSVPVLLSGIGAEAVVLSKHQEPVHLGDLLRRGRLGQLRRELDRWQRALKMPFSNLVWRYCLQPLLARPLISYGLPPRVHDWIDRGFAVRWNLRDRARRGNMPRAGRGAADQWHVERIGWITGFLLRGYLEKACDIRYPFLHRPLVELALSMPWSLKAVPGEPKAILRRAMKGILPERVRRRTQNASTGHAVYNGLRKEWPVLEKLVDSSVLVELGAVDRERLRTALHLARQGHAPDLGGLLSTLTLDAWLQYAFHGRQRPGANAEAA